MKVRRKVVGAFERVVFPDFGDAAMVAKIDTGAYSGAIHATKIKITELEDGTKVLDFNLLGKKSLPVRAYDYSIITVKSSNGGKEKRYMVDTRVDIEGQVYPISITLTDREKMSKPVLIGRKFLRTHNFLVDVRKGGAYRTQKREKK